jgi:SagB-type dehydrogenase family enzyme
MKNLENSIGKEFIEKTKYQHLDKSDQMKGIPQPLLEKEYDKTKALIDLPIPKDIIINEISLRKAIERRKTIREYSKKPISIDDLSYLLWCTQGVKEIVPNLVTRRTVPSAGARHAFETYLLINNVSSLKPGLYRFLALKHKLLEINLDSNIADDIVRGCHDQYFVKTGAVTFIWVAVTNRMMWRFNERGYRYLYFDAGHVCQNLYLSAEAIDCGVCAIGAFSDDEMNEILNLDGVNEFVIYLGAVGKK